MASAMETHSKYFTADGAERFKRERHKGMDRRQSEILDLFPQSSGLSQSALSDGGDMDVRPRNGVGDGNIPRKAFPPCHGMSVKPSDFFPSDRDNPAGSLTDGIPARTRARWTRSLM